MKKYKIKYLLFAAITVINTSCDDLLDVPPQGKLVKEEFWLSKDQAVAAIAGIYSCVGSTSYNFSSGNLSATAVSPVESYIYWGELRGEILKSNSGKLPSAQIEKENIDNLNVSPADVTTKYTQFYKIINLANHAIKYIPGVKDNDPAFTQVDEANLMGEAYFLRAYAYFWLTRAFKEVPLVLDPSETDTQNYDVPKSTSDVLYQQIISDLDKAVSSLPEWYSNPQYARCRATKYTAKTVLADVYLTLASISSGGNINGYYDQAISNCDDVINSLRYTLIPGVSFGSLFTVGATDESIFETYANQKLNDQVNNLYDWFTSIGLFMVSDVTDELFNKVTAADYRSSVPPAGPYPERGTAVSYLASSRYVGKYSSSTKDSRWIFYRLPDVLLMKAEALAHRYQDDVAKLAEACNLVNKIRYRAFGINDYPKVEATSTYEMDNILLDERGREFIGEGKRWFELVRFASRNNFAAKELLINRIVQSLSGIDQLVITPRVSNPDSWYLPLNTAALDASPSLVQNPFYQ
jgi:hypothetical protein